MGRRVVFSELPLLLAAPVCHEMVTARDRNQAVRCDDVNIFPLPTDTYYHYTPLSLLTPPRIVLRVEQAD